MLESRLSSRAQSVQLVLAQEANAEGIARPGYRRIAQLTDHLKSHAKDHSSRRGLLKMVAMRRSLLDYLSKSESERYKKLLEKLNLRK